MENDAESSSTSDESLDAKSDKFEPLKALYSLKLRIPVSNARVYDNVSKYETVTRCTIESPSSSSSRIVDKESKKQNAELSEYPRRRFLPHQGPIAGGSKSRVRRNYKKNVKDENKEEEEDNDDDDDDDDDEDDSKRNVLTRMKGTLGPLEMLLRCMEHRTRVKVYTRGARSIRGYVLAYVVAFDKHWNLALEDCIEVWTRKVKRKAPALGIPADVNEMESNKQQIKKSDDGKTETVERHVPQLMVRGEQIAIIVKIE